MSSTSMYKRCCHYDGKIVRLTEHDGKIHIAEMTNVNREFVWLRPVGNWRGFGLGYPMALAFIAGITLASAPF
ncbi:hypothetical protein BTO30_10830 [Domibacillus antri]|uniref:Uncharacterized protein n=1 Tax=Domibacillus antri TaxID=1714264 RepID=A0A1Q8Q4F3_9BACI|nr:hypothetical protein [Domibacillus antri]OLN22234.1 hypothetical protein BTO30_10830 [Domibacillus antri]